MKSLTRRFLMLLAAGAVVLSVSSASAQSLRQTKLFIDDNQATPHFATLVSGALTGSATISIPAGAVNSNFILSSLSGGQTITGGLTSAGVLDMSGNYIHNVTDPSAPQDAATMAYVDAKISSDVHYNVTAAQNTATVGAHDLFNVAYNTTDATAAGAVINATTGGTNVSATGLTVGANVATAGGTVTGISASAQGGGTSSSNATLGVVGLANASSFTLPITGQSAWANTSSDFEGGGVGVLGYNLTDEDNQFAGYFYGNKTDKSSSQATGVLTAINDIRSAIDGTTNAQPAAGEFRLYDNTAVTYNSPDIAAPVAMYAEAYSVSDNSEVIGSFSHAWNTANDGGTAAAGALGALAYGYGSSATSGLTAKVSGSVGFAGGTSTATYNLIGVEGATQPYGGTTESPVSTGGYFFAQQGQVANLGMVSQVGGTINEGWKEGNGAIGGGDLTGKLSGKNIAVAGINYNAYSANDFAAYFQGAVNVGGTTSPLEMQGSAGTTGQVLTSAGAGATPTWTTPTTGTVTAVGATAPLSSTGGNTPNISISLANASTDGYLSSTDWSTFNSKQAALTTGNVSTSTSGVTVGGSPTGAVIGSGVSVDIATASGSQNGLLSSTDWSTFNSKAGSGANTDITSANNMTAATSLTSVGTLSNLKTSGTLTMGYGSGTGSSITSAVYEITSGGAITLPSATSGQVLTILNSTGSATTGDVIIPAGASARLVYGASAWVLLSIN